MKNELDKLFIKETSEMKARREAIGKKWKEADKCQKAYTKLQNEIRKSAYSPVQEEIKELIARVKKLKRSMREKCRPAYESNAELQRLKAKNKLLWKELQKMHNEDYNASITENPTPKDGGKA